MKIDTTEKGIQQAKLYAGNTMPKNAKLIGLLKRDNKNTGALIQFDNGNYAQLNAGVLKAVKID